MNLTITDNETGREYAVPEQLRELLINEGCTLPEKSWDHLKFEYDEWQIVTTYPNELIRRGEPQETFFRLDLSRFTLSFPNSISKEKVENAFKTATDILGVRTQSNEGAWYILGILREKMFDRP